MRLRIQRGRHSVIAIMTTALAATGNAYSVDDPAAQAFVQGIVAAINRKDDDARKSLMHPDALACSQAQKRAMEEGAFVPEWNPIPANYRWQISPMPGNSAGWFSGKINYPVRPTHQLQIDFDAGPALSQSIVLQVVRYGNEWREVTGCPKAETVVEAKAAAKARGQQEERIRKLAASIPVKLKSEVQQLLAEGHKVGAIMQYRDATNEDLAVAKGVVERLIEESEARSVR